MSLEKILLDEATCMANRLEGGVAALEAELLAIEQRKIETEAELKAAKLARTRLLDFRTRLEHGYQCPHCWIEKESSQHNERRYPEVLLLRIGVRNSCIKNSNHRLVDHTHLPVCFLTCSSLLRSLGL